MTQYSPYPQYQQPPYQPDMGYSSLPHPNDQEGLGGWVLTVLLTLIPLVNIIYLLVLAFGSGNSVAKRNFARASLIWMLVSVVFSIVVAIMFAAAGLSLLQELLSAYGL